MGIYDRDYYKERGERNNKSYVKWIIAAVVLIILLLILVKGF